jgi:hypothetical protein
MYRSVASFKSSAGQVLVGKRPETLLFGLILV